MLCYTPLLLFAFNFWCCPFGQNGIRPAGVVRKVRPRREVGLGTEAPEGNSGKDQIGGLKHSLSSFATKAAILTYYLKSQLKSGSWAVKRPLIRGYSTPKSAVTIPKVAILLLACKNSLRVSLETLMSTWIAWKFIQAVLNCSQI